MTGVETIATALSVISLVIAGVSAAIAGVALWRTDRAERREREAIIAIRNVWCGTPGIDDSMIFSHRGDGGAPFEWIRRNKPPADAEQQLVIVMESRGNSGVLVRQSDEEIVLELRPATVSDNSDRDGPGGRNTYYVLLEVRNVGRWAATDVRIECTVAGTFLSHDPENDDNIELSFPEQVITFEALAANEPRYVRVRNMTGLPVSLCFDQVSVGNDQPIRLAPTEVVDFQPRGYRS